MKPRGKENLSITLQPPSSLTLDVECKSPTTEGNDDSVFGDLEGKSLFVNGGTYIGENGMNISYNTTIKIIKGDFKQKGKYNFEAIGMFESEMGEYQDTYTGEVLVLPKQKKAKFFIQKHVNESDGVKKVTTKVKTVVSRLNSRCCQYRFGFAKSDDERVKEDEELKSEFGLFTEFEDEMDVTKDSFL